MQVNKLKKKKQVRNLRESSSDLFLTPLARSNKGYLCLSFSIIKIVNKIFRQSIYLSFSDFNYFLKVNIYNFSSKFFFINILN